MADKKPKINGVEFDINEHVKNAKTEAAPKVASFTNHMWNTGSKTKEELNKENSLIQQEIQQEVENQEYDGIFSTAGKWIHGVFMETAASIEDAIGALDVGDWRLPVVEDSGADVIFNGLFKAIDNTIGDGENDTGNWFTRRAAAVREKSNIVDKINTGYETFDYVANGTKNLVGSITGFALSGGGYAKAGQLLGASKFANQMGTAWLMTQAGSAGIAQGVHDKIYEERMLKMSPQLNRQKEFAENKAYQLHLQNNPMDYEGAEYAKLQAGKNIISQFAQENPEIDLKAKESAAKGASATIKANAPSFFLNILSSGLFLKGTQASRNLLTKPNKYLSKEVPGEMIQEAFEEGVIENLAEKYGLATGRGQEYGMSDAMKDLFTLETLESAVWGAIGGGGQTMITNRLTYGERKKAFDEQQITVKKWDALANADSDLLNNLVSFTTTMKDLSSLAKKQQDLIDAGKNAEAEIISNSIFYNQAKHAFDTGTTEALINAYTKISKNKNIKPETREKATKALAQVERLEKIYNNSKEYRNSESIYANRANKLMLSEYLKDLDKEVLLAQTEVETYVNSLIQTKELDTYLENITKKTDRGDAIAERRLEFNYQDIFTNPYEDKLGKDKYDEFLKNLNSSASGKKLKQLSKTKKDVEKTIASLNVEYDKFTSSSYQTSLKNEEFLAKDLNKAKTRMTDDNIEEVAHQVINNYKGKILDERLEYFKQRYSDLQEAKKAQEKAKEEEALKKEAEKINNEKGKPKQKEFVKATNTTSDNAQKEKVQNRNPQVTKNPTTDNPKPSSKKIDLSKLSEDDFIILEDLPINEDRKNASQGIVNAANSSNTKTTDDVSDNEYDTFVNSGKVSKDRINSIADKMKNNVRLTKREKAIFTDKTSEINERLRELNKVSQSYTKADDDSEAIFFEPKELSNNLSQNALNAIKAQTNNFVSSLEFDLDRQPTFEEFVRDFVRHTSKDVADTNFNVLVKGWELNGYPVADYQQVYNRVFLDRKEFANALTSIDGLFKETTPQQKQEDLIQEEKEQFKKTKDTKTDNQGNLIQTGFVTSEVKPKLAHLSKLNKQMLIEEEDGNTYVEYEYTEDELNTGEYVNSLKLLHPDKFHPRTKLMVVIPNNADDMLVPMYNEDGTKGKAITWKEWKVGKDVNSQEYKDKQPMVVLDEEGEPVAFIHDRGWYHSSRFNEDENHTISQAVTALRNVRNMVMANPNGVEIVITEKRGGVLQPFKIPENQPMVTLQEANPQSSVGVVIGDKLTTNKGSFKEKLINSQELRNGSVYDIRRIGLDEEGNKTYIALPTTPNNITEVQQNNIANAIRIYLNAENAVLNDRQRNKIKDSKNDILNLTGLDLHNPGDLEEYLNQFIRTFSAKVDSVEELALMADSKLPAFTPYLATQNKSVIVGVAGKKKQNGKPYFQYMNPLKLKENKQANSTATTLMKILKEEVLPNVKLNSSKVSIIKNKPVVNINNDLSTEIASETYSQYLKDNLYSNIQSANIGTKENPVYVTFAQPVITFELTGNVSRSKMPVISKSEPQGKNDKLTYTKDSDIQQAITSPQVSESLEFQGDTLEEKVEDAKNFINDENASKEEVEVIEKALEENLEHLIDKANHQLNWISDSELYYEPIELSDEDVQSIIETLDIIKGINPLHQFYLVDYLYNQIKNIDDNTKINEVLQNDIKRLVSEKRNEFNNVKQKLELFKDKDARVTTILSKYDKAFETLNSIENNADTFISEAFNKYKHYTGNEITLEVDGEENLLGGNYSKTSLEENAKDTASYRMKMFLSGYQKVNDNGTLETAFLGLPKYVSFDEAYNTIAALLVDIAPNFDKQIKVLEEANISWLQDIVKDLKNADNQVRNEFSSLFTKHGLQMEFVMYSYDKKQKRYTLKVYETNANAVERVVRRTWYDNFKNGNLVKVNNGVYEIDKVQLKALRDEFSSWINIPKNLPSKFLPEVKSVLSNRSKVRNKVLLKALNNGGEYIFNYKNTNYIISKSGIKKYVSSNAVQDLIMGDTSEMTISEAKPILEKYLANFGITVNPKVLEDLITKGMYYNRSKIPFSQMFNSSDNSVGLFGLLDNYLSYVETLNSTSLEEDGINPLDNSVVKALSKLQGKYIANKVSNSFRDGGKSVYGFTPTKFITDRVKALQDQNFRNELRKLSFNQNSLWLNLLDGDMMSDFKITHLGLNAIKEYGKNVFGDNSITKLSDADHELVKLGMFQDYSQGTHKIGLGNIDLRTARVFTPTMSDKSVMTIIKTTVLDLKNKNFDKDLKPNDEVIELLFNQLVEPELKRITNFHSKTKATNIKNYDKGAGLFLMLPNLNNIRTKEGNSLIEGMKKYPDTFNYNEVRTKYANEFKAELRKYVDTLVIEKLKVWENNGYITSQDGKFTEAKYFDFKYIDNDYKFKGDLNTKIKLAASDFVINNLISNANFFMTVIGDPAVYYKSKPSKDYHTQSIETFINVGKRLGAMMAPGTQLANSENDKYIQVFLDDKESISENIEFLTKLLDDKVFDKAKWESINNIEDKDKRSKEIKSFIKGYPNSEDYFFIEGTDAQEYTTWQEHLYVLEKLGRLPDVAISITPEEIRNARELFRSGISKEMLNDAQRALLKKVLQPIKPVYTGQIVDENQDVLRMMYIKTSSFPLIPQLTQGLEIDKLRVSMEKLQEDEGKLVRASYQSGNKVGALSNPAKVHNTNGTVNGVSVDNSLVLNRKDFRIQLDVPFKSGKKKEDTVSTATQTTKLLFGNGILEEGKVFEYNGNKLTGRELHAEYISVFGELINNSKQQLLDELGLNTDLSPKDLDKTTAALRKLLVEEAQSRNYPKQDVEALGIEPIKNSVGDTVDMQFTLPLWMSANSNRFESLLNAIVTNRIIKMKMPGNSYVAGSQEGFQIQDNFDGIDKNSIVWTSSWTGNLQAAKFREDGSFQPTQILVGSKFRTNDGELIDLLERTKTDEYKYVTETKQGFRINEDMFDKDLFNLSSFRIPTSGHMSMSSMEIVGFLPYEVGDLMIVPRNLTTQKGLDFDVDKETTYQFHHKINKDGKFVRVNESNSKNTKKILQNKLVEIHKAVLSSSSKTVQKKINAILSISFENEQAEFIDKLVRTSEDNTYFTPLSDEYQKQKMFLGAVGKIGIGAYSLDVTAQSLLEQARLTNNLPVRLTDEEGNTISITVGNFTSDGILGKSNTLDGSRTIAQVLGARQNIATDNEKEQVMGRVNLNSFTLDVDKMFNMLGFDKGKDGNSISFLFLSQPIIREYVSMMANAKSSTQAFDANLEDKVVEKLHLKYAGSKKGISNPQYDSLMNNEKLISQFNEENVDKKLQSAILSKFMQLKKYGEALRKIQKAINIDSAGLGVSIFENIASRNALASLSTNKLISNAESLIGDYISSKEIQYATENEMKNDGYFLIGNQWIKPTTIAGMYAVNALHATKMWDKFFPYDTPVMEKILEEINELSVGENISLKRKFKVIQELKKYYNSSLNNNVFENLSAQDERKRLFFDGENKVSIAAYLKNLFRQNSVEVQTYIKGNKLLNKFEFEINEDGKPSLIKFNNASAESFDENYLYNSLLELMVKEIPLPSFNGETYNTRKLAQDLVSYSLLEGGVQEATQFSKFLPMSYLNQIGYSRELRRKHNQLFKGDAGLGIKEDSISKFTFQFFLNNPQLLQKIDDEGIKKVNENSKGFSPIPPNQKYKFPQLIAEYDASIKVGKKFNVYFYNGSKYIKVPTLGIFGMSEYDMDRLRTYSSLVNGGNEIVTKPVTSKPIPQKKNPFGIRSADNMAQVLYEISKKDTAEGKLASLLLEYSDNTATIEISNIPQRGAYNSETHTITISEDRLNANENEVANTFLKETIHALTVREMLKYVDEQGNLKTKEVPKVITKLVRLFRVTEKHLGEDLQRLRNLPKGTPLKKEDKRIIYGGYDILEFVEMIMTQPEFQQEMNKVQYLASDKTLWEKFKEIIKSFLQEIIPNLKKDNVTAQSIDAVFELLESKKTETKESFTDKVNEDIDSHNEILNAIDNEIGTDNINNFTTKQVEYLLYDIVDFYQNRTNKTLNEIADEYNLSVDNLSVNNILSLANNHINTNNLSGMQALNLMGSISDLNKIKKSSTFEVEELTTGNEELDNFISYEDMITLQSIKNSHKSKWYNELISELERTLRYNPSKRVSKAVIHTFIYEKILGELKRENIVNEDNIFNGTENDFLNELSFMYDQIGLDFNNFSYQYKRVRFTGTNTATLPKSKETLLLEMEEKGLLNKYCR